MPAADAQLATVLLTHRGTLPAPLVTAIARRVGKGAGAAPVALLHRPELTEDDAEIVAEAVSVASRFFSVEFRANLLARRRVRDHVDLMDRIKQITTYRPLRATTAEVVTFVMKNPQVSPALLDLMATSDDPAVLATYAHHTQRGCEDRVAALTRLEALLGPDARRISPDAAYQAARALELLVAEEPEAGRAQLRATRTRGILLALATETGRSREDRRVFADLDAETRAHLVREAVLPTVTAAKVTRKDEAAVAMMVDAMLPDLDLDVVRSLMPLMPPTIREKVAAEVRRLSDEDFSLGHRTLGEMVTRTKEHDRAAAAGWILATLKGTDAYIGWDAALTLTEQLGSDATLEQLCDLISGVARPADVAS